MRKLLQLNSYKRKEFEDCPIPKKSHEILKIPDDKVDVEVLAKKYIAERIENDEMNKLGFYDIVPDRFDLSPQSKKNPFKSIHNPNESYLLAMQKFYEKKKYNYLERKLREELMSKTGNKLLLNEIYEQMNENHESVIKRKRKIEENIAKFNLYKPETEQEMVGRLERWQKHSKKNTQTTQNGSDQRAFSNEKSRKIKESLSNLPKISESVDNPNISENEKHHEEGLYSANNVKFPEIVDSKKREKETLNEENFNVDEENLMDSAKIKIDLILNQEYKIDSFSKKALFYGKVVDQILGKLNKRINYLDSVIFKKNKHLVLFRSESSVIAEKIQSIKTLFVDLNKDLQRSQEIAMETQKSKKLKSSNSKKSITSSILNQMVSAGKIDQSRLDEFITNNSALSKNSTQNFETEFTDAKPEYKIQLRGDLNFYLQKQRFNKKIIEETEEFIRPLKKEQKKLVKLRLNFLKSLLKKGKDYRNDGISWLIRLLWGYGESVKEKELPEFLDSKAKEFLLEKARNEKFLLENETFKKISLEVYKSNINKEDSMIYESFLSKTILKEDDKNILPNEIIYEQSELSQNQNITSRIEDKDERPEKKDEEAKGKDEEAKGKNEEDQEKILPRSMERSRRSISMRAKTEAKEEASPFNTKIKKIIYKDLETSPTGDSKPSKKTIHDLIYLETKKKIHEMVRSSIHQIDKTILPYNDKSTLTFDISNLQNFENYIALYEDNSNINSYQNREDFIQKYDQTQKNIGDIEEKVTCLIDEEVIRIFKEFGMKNFEIRFRVDLITVLCVLFGARRTRRELMKNGYFKNIKKT